MTLRDWKKNPRCHGSSRSAVVHCHEPKGEYLIPLVSTLTLMDWGLDGTQSSTVSGQLLACIDLTRGCKQRDR